MDVYSTVKRIHKNMNQTAVTSDAAKMIGTDNEFLLFKVFLDKVTDDSVKEIQPHWIKSIRRTSHA